MATLKPRITITLEPHRHELLRRVAAARGVTMSSVVAELVETVAEPLERMCVVVEAANRAPGEVEAGLRQAMTAVDRNFRHHAEKAIEQHDLFLDLAAGAVVTPSDPRPVITGVRSRGKAGLNPVAARVGGNSRKNGPSHSRSIKKGG